MIIPPNALLLFILLKIFTLILLAYFSLNLSDCANHVPSDKQGNNQDAGQTG